MDNNRDYPPQQPHGQPSRHRATTRVTLNVPAGEDKRPRTPDTFEREFNSFFRKNSSEIYNNVPQGSSGADNRFYYDPFTDFSTRNNSNFFKEFQDSLPNHLRHSRFNDPGEGLRPHDIRISPGYNQTRQGHRSVSNQNTPTGPAPGTPPPKVQIDEPNQRFEPGTTEDRVWRPTREMTSSHASGGGAGPRRNSGGHNVRFGDNSSDSVTSSMKSMTSSQRRDSDVAASSISRFSEGRSPRSETTTVSQSDEELRTHGPSYTMFKLDDPQTEISEEFPNRERIRKLSQQLNKNPPPTPHYNIYNPPPIEETSSESESLSPNPALPDWKANVVIGENFSKRHLSISRQGTTINVTAQKTTESVQLGRKQLTREWRVVAPEVVDSQSIQAEFLEDERKLIITGYFDKLHLVEIK